MASLNQQRPSTPTGSSSFDPPPSPQHGSPAGSGRDSAQVAAAEWQEPLYSAEELRGVVPADARQAWDVRDALARILDGSEFEEFKSNYGKTLVTGQRIS